MWQYCYIHDRHGTYVGDELVWFYVWSCPASHITIKTAKGDDKITVDPSVQIGTEARRRRRGRHDLRRIRT